MYSLPRIFIAGIMSGWMLFSSNSAFGQATPSTGATPESAQAKQTRLLNALNSPELTAEKAAAFEDLAVFGTREVIPVLAPMLSDEKLAHYARFALEANPDPAVDKLFRQSLDQLSGNLLIGVINSIGVRKDAQAIAALTALLAHENVEVAAAAAQRAGLYRHARSWRSADGRSRQRPAPQRAGIGRGCIVCAENLNKAGSRDIAIAMYDLVSRCGRRPSHPPGWSAGSHSRSRNRWHRASGRTAAVRPARLGRCGIRAARELQTAEVVPALIGSLGNLPPESAAGVILAIGDRGDAQATPVVAAALASKSAEVRHGGSPQSEENW